MLRQHRAHATSKAFGQITARTHCGTVMCLQPSYSAGLAAAAYGLAKMLALQIPHRHSYRILYLASPYHGCLFLFVFFLSACFLFLMFGVHTLPLSFARRKKKMPAFSTTLRRVQCRALAIDKTAKHIGRGRSQNKQTNKQMLYSYQAKRFPPQPPTSRKLDGIASDRSAHSN